MKISPKTLLADCRQAAHKMPQAFGVVRDAFQNAARLHETVRKLDREIQSASRAVGDAGNGATLPARLEDLNRLLVARANAEQGLATILGSPGQLLEPVANACNAAAAVAPIVVAVGESWFDLDEELRRRLHEAAPQVGWAGEA